MDSQLRDEYNKYIQTRDFKRIMQMYIGRWNHLERPEKEQIVHLALWQSFKNYDPNKGTKFSTFFFNNIRYEYLDHMTALGKNRTVLFSELDADGVVEKPVRHKGYSDVNFNELVSVVSDKTEAVLRMRFVEGRTLDDIGNIMGFSKENARRVVKDGLKKIRYAIA